MTGSKSENNSAAERKPFFDLQGLIASKNPRLLRIMPGFLLSYLKRVIHEKELNDFMYNFQDRIGVDFLSDCLDEFGVNLELKGLENIPAAGKITIASNHPLGGMDGMALILAASKVRKEICFPVNDLLMNVPNLQPLFIPINKHGSNAGNIQIMNETYASNKTLLYFPAGLCSRMVKGEIIDLDWKKTFITKSKIFQRDIIPTYINGRNSSFFYRLANFRKLLGLKANIEMLYLIDEMFKQRNKPLIITFGKPIPYTVFDKRHSDTEWASRLRSHVYAIREGKDNFTDFI
ncbi:MAG: glycerol acyltransferase [Bacteroidota bacterium]